MNSQDELLRRIFDADRALRMAQAEFFTQGADEARLDALGAGLNTAWEDPDPEESAARLMRVGMLLGELSGPRTCKLLLRLLDHEEPEVRLPAGESLQDLAYSRYAEIHNGRATWGQFGLTVAIGAILLVVGIWLLTEATGIL